MSGTKRYASEDERRAARNRSKSEYYYRNRGREQQKARERAQKAAAKKIQEKAVQETQKRQQKADKRRIWLPRTFALTGGQFQLSDLKSLRGLHSCLAADFALSPSTAAEWEALTTEAIKIEEMPEIERKPKLSALMGVHTMRIDFVSQIAAAAEVEAKLRHDHEYTHLFNKIYSESLTATICEMEICINAKAGTLHKEHKMYNLEWQQ